MRLHLVSGPAPKDIHASLDGPSLTVLPLVYAYVRIRAANKYAVVSNVIYAPKKANLSQSWLLLFLKVAIYTKIICLSYIYYRNDQKLFNEMNKFLFSLVFL